MQDIILGFRPRAVIVTSNSYNGDYTGIALDGYDFGNNGIQINSSGFSVGNYLNAKDSSYQPFRYIAFRWGD